MKSGGLTYGARQAIEPCVARCCRTSSDPFKVARAIDHLLGRGLISRDADPADRRRVHLRLTEQGWRTYREVERFSQEVERAVRATLPGAEVAVFERVLDVLDERVAALVAPT